MFDFSFSEICLHMTRSGKEHVKMTKLNYRHDIDITAFLAVAPRGYITQKTVTK